MEEKKIETLTTNFESFPRIRIILITPDYYLYPTDSFYFFLKEELKLT